MASTTLVLGGARSGKSRFAVDCHLPRARVTTIAALCDAIAAPAPEAARDAQRHLDTLTKPPGSLGRLEELATRLAALTGAPPHVTQPVIFTFAADHGVAVEGVSAYPPSVTA